MIDTHTHLYLPEFDDGASAVERAVSAGVGKMIFPNVGFSTVEPMLSLARRFPRNVRCAIGLHPTEVRGDFREQIDGIFAYLSDSEFVAVGEIGIDLYWDKTFREQEMQAFDIQCAKAVQLGLPVIIHCRDGLDETLEVLQAYRGLPAVFHSFGGTEEDVEKIRETGDYYFGINGIVTFKNSKLREVLPAIGADRILLETDSPYLSPVPFRGKRNESAYLPYIASCVADSLNMPVGEVDRITTCSAGNLFGF